MYATTPYERCEAKFSINSQIIYAVYTVTSRHDTNGRSLGQKLVTNKATALAKGLGFRFRLQYHHVGMHDQHLLQDNHNATTTTRTTSCRACGSSSRAKRRSIGRRSRSRTQTKATYELRVA